LFPSQLDGIYACLLLARCAMCHEEDVSWAVSARPLHQGSKSICLACMLSWGQQLHSPSTVESPNGKAPKGGCHYQGNVCVREGVEEGGFMSDFHGILFYFTLFHFILFYFFH